MIKISAHIQKKLPLQGFEYSSQSFSAGLEIEVSDADRPEAIQARIREMYSLLSASIDEQLAQAQSRGNGQQPTEVAQPRASRIPPANGGNGHGSGQRSNRRGQRVPATTAQVKAINAIAAEQDLDLAAALAPYQVNRPEELSIRDASGVIDDLKAKKTNGNRR